MNAKQALSVQGKKILITGGARGIGKAVARVLLEAGAETALVDIDAPMAKKSAAELSALTGGRCEGLTCDVTDPAGVQAMTERFVQRFGRLDGVFNNAGICIHRPALDVSPEEWNAVIGTNLTGVFCVAQASARLFVRQGGGGAIVNTASMSGTIVNVPQQQAAYNASKAAVVHLTKSLAVEWAPLGIRVNCISPGYIETEMTGAVRQDWRDAWVASIPFGRMGRPEELAGAVIYLLSDAAGYTSGSQILIDGCFTCV
jgi:sorbose reductase